MGDSAAAHVERRICDGSPDVRLAFGHGVGGMLYPFTSVLYEPGFDFLYVDGNCHYWTQPPSVIPDEYYLLRPYREGVLTAEQERELHDTVSYDDVPGRECAAEFGALDAGTAFLWDGSAMRNCSDWNFPPYWPLRQALYVAGTDMTGPMRLQVGEDNSLGRPVTYEWPLDTPIEQYTINYNETRSFRVDDAAAVAALRALRERAITDAAASGGYFGGHIAIGASEGDVGHVLALRDELPFADARGSWHPELPTTSGAGDDDFSPAIDASFAQARCDGWAGDASSGRREAQDGAARSCNVDTDCTIVDYGLPCFADCGYPSAVSRDGVPALEAAVQSLNTQHCAPFQANGCPAPDPLPCTPPEGEPVAVCRGGQCTLELVPHP
ncbi:MAG TPA: hypothetical protein VMG12_42440 [Polyangiaceae bacterium]|nr:hypothetical protein [Polyangiaceae bacterium]